MFDIMKNKFKWNDSLLNRLTVMLRKADRNIEAWVQHFIDQIEKEYHKS